MDEKPQPDHADVGDVSYQPPDAEELDADHGSVATGASGPVSVSPNG